MAISEDTPEHIKTNIETFSGIAERLYRNNDIGIEGFLVAGNRLEVISVGVAL